MERVVNTKVKIAFKLDEPVELSGKPGDRLVLDRTSERGYVAYVVPRARFKADFTEHIDEIPLGDGPAGTEAL